MARRRPGPTLLRRPLRLRISVGCGRRSFKRLLLGAAAVACALGLLLVRVFLTKYANLAGAPVDRYVAAATADHAFLIALQMWIVAAAVALVGHSLFPDERDFRILMAEPVGRAEIFGAKLAALLGFASLFAVGAYAALLPLFGLSLLGPQGSGGALSRGAAYSVACLVADVFAALAVVALHGVLVLIAPPARLVALGAGVRSVLLGLLVLALPMIARLPASADAWTHGAWWLAWAPPAWFTGLERWLLGDAGRFALTLRALTATAASALIAAATYVILYRHFDRVILRPHARPPAPARYSRRRSTGRHSSGQAVLAFVRATFGRSVLHQGIVLSLMAVGGGLVVNGLVSRDPRALLLWAPFPLIIIGVPAVRLALAVPIEPRANWIFRMTDDRDVHADVVGAGVRTVFTLGVAIPVALVAPFQAVWFGWQALLLVGVESLIGWFLVEWLMRDWRSIPFTCAYVPGKGFVPQMFVRGLGAFIVFTTAGAALLALSVVRPSAAAVPWCVLATAGIVLLRRRRRLAVDTTLAFEDDLPTDVNPLRLNVD
ncbi:MAG: hypothetical protein ACM4AI_09900 [Acidobacteriota bacterium]